MADITRGSVLYDAEGNEVCTVIAVNPMNDPGRVVLDFHTNENAKKWEREFYQVGREKRVNLNGLKQMINDVVFLEPPKTEEPVSEEEDAVPGKMLEEDVSPLAKTKEYAKDLAQVGQISVSELEERIKQILAIMKEQEAEEVVEKSKNAFDQISSHVSSKEKLGEAKGDGTKKSIKELIGEIFPSLSFYPALGIWSMVDKMISSGKGFESLTPEQTRLLPVYISLFFGLVGGKIAYNRLKEYVATNDKIDNEINEALKAAGIQLDEKRETWDVKYGDEYLGSAEIERDEKTGEGKTVREFEKTPLEQAVDYVYNGMQEKYGRQFPEEEDEDEYRSELCDAASKKFNVPCDEIIDKFASDYVDTMPYVTKDENGEYTEIPDDVHQLTSSIYEELHESVESNLDDAKAFVSNELQAKFGAAIPENDDEKGYVDDLINMATMKFNVPEDSLRNALGLVEEEPIEEPKEPSEEVPGEKIEEV